ncbi:MBOAT family O-acyltransferase [Ferdinandcohnia quinoae]|uniref:MBOAT family protein n=1 Tax=Fredinandcohnia quinoae TaxID=2918902 RepID=A0AAW5DWT1_9BACI|nr:MBOAT family protein [Fredinandcohnia sp. SECRCQ15]
MLFNSFEFIFLFLPVVFIVYFILNKLNYTVSKIWLLGSSLFFYGWWNPSYLPLIISSLVVNYCVGTLVGKKFKTSTRKLILTAGILFNVGLLGYFKYTDFLIANVNTVLSTHFHLFHLALPLAISFYTFQQIAYLVDSYRMETNEYNFLNYSLFVTFFPQLIAGPIVHHKQIMSQFDDATKRTIHFKNIALGLFVFAIGLFKKVAIADQFSAWAVRGFDQVPVLHFFDAWATALSYTFQLYFDFSGYSDMAIGIGLLFNIALPMNFNSPYKALNIQDFWRRWHITLSNFLTRYIYIPLGGNRKGIVLTYVNILIVFFVSGIWHGAGWTFVLWGILHGLASVIYRFWNTNGYKMNRILAWFITFNFINATWVLFRATSFSDAMKVYKGMLGLNGFGLADSLTFANIVSYKFTLIQTKLPESTLTITCYLLVFFLICVFARNSLELRDRYKPTWINIVFVSYLFLYSVFNLHKVSEFLYFNF